MEREAEFLLVKFYPRRGSLVRREEVVPLEHGMAVLIEMELEAMPIEFLRDLASAEETAIHLRLWAARAASILRFRKGTQKIEPYEPVA